ncbi:hypothetical protein KGF56_000672 [Candida oxycetoniae]|uniref:Sugar phosphate transporter domain-containing protein n=1 Tax=Candida oxycetoniae TaxID=497107 RepID=A0AAI9T1W3_9ASCO|nr:uncharacterized protein KGF56_000672 [Candida oxycetoniae]KAI3406540.2 hypothetical protein KGF56_000672 [Candida oxycetoniae]
MPIETRKRSLSMTLLHDTHYEEAREGGAIADTKRKVSYERSTLEATVYILGWYLFSLSISIYNKWMFGSSGLDFKFPIIITSFHQLCLFFLSGSILFFQPSLRPVGINNRHYQEMNLWRFIQQGISMDLKMYLKNILPCSIASAGDIGISNVSISLISLSLYTMLKTSSLMFVLIFGLVFKLEKFNWRLIVIVVVMVGSVIMMTEKYEAGGNDDSSSNTTNEDSKVGIFLVILASMLSGLRWSCTQILLKTNQYTSNSISTIFYVSPAMGIILFLLGILIEGMSNFTQSPIWDHFGTFKTIILLIIPGVLAFMMTLCEFKLLGVAQIMTLSIAGIFKELLTILLSSIIFGDRLSWINWLGLFVTFCDILWYNYYRYTQNDGNDAKGTKEDGYRPINQHTGDESKHDGSYKLTDLEINEESSSSSSSRNS